MPALEKGLKPKRRGFSIQWLRPVVAPLLLFTVWQLIAVRLGNALILPTLDSVIGVILNPFQDLLRLGSMLHNAQVSLVRVLLGYGIAALIGIPLGIVMGYSAHARVALQGYSL